MSEHYTATVEVTKTTHTEETVYNQTTRRNETRQKDREVQDVARVVLRSTSLEALSSKIKATLDAVIYE